GTSGSTQAARLTSMAATYRRFALDHSNRYGIIYSPNALEDPEVAAASAFAARPLFEELEAAGLPRGHLLPLARTFTAWLHGFVSMEIVHAFRLGGSIAEAFDAGLATILRELLQPRKAPAVSDRGKY